MNPTLLCALGQRQLIGLRVVAQHENRHGRATVPRLPRRVRSRTDGLCNDPVKRPLRSVIGCRSSVIGVTTSRAEGRSRSKGRRTSHVPFLRLKVGLLQVIAFLTKPPDALILLLKRVRSRGQADGRSYW